MRPKESAEIALGKQRGGLMTGAVLVSLFLLISPALSRPATLVRDGKPSSVIVVPDGYKPVAQQAAELLQSTLAKMTGATIPIEPEARAGPSASIRRVWVSVGDTRFARSKGLRFEALGPEEIRLTVAPEYVIVAGNDGPAGCAAHEIQRGTYFAAVELLERLGVRWLWPGKGGEVIPARRTVSLGPLRYAYTPPLIQRHLRFTAKDGEFKYGVRLKDAGLEPGDWPEKMRLGYSRRINIGHNFGDWYEKYFKIHPEYFATGEDGKSFGWLNNVQRSKLCVSNPAVLEQVVKEALEFYHGCANPKLASFSLSPTDNQAGHCMCANCRKWDAMDGPRESWNFCTGEGGKTCTTVHHVSLTDRYLTFWNRVAERLEQQAPGLLLGAIAYGVYRHPPVHVRAHRNLVIAYVGMDYTNEAIRRTALIQWDGWAARVGRMMFRPNCMREGYGFPLLWPVRMAQDLKHFVRTGLIGVDIANIHQHWATQGLNYYVLARMLWNPQLEPWGIIDDYCRAGFGPAAPAVRRYFSKLIQLTDQLAAYNGRHETDVGGILARGEATEDVERGPSKPRASLLPAWEAIYTQAAIGQLEGCLSEARRLAARPEHKARVEFLALGSEYAKLDLKMKQALARYLRDPESKEKMIDFVRALAALEQWRKQHTSSQAVGVVAGNYWFFHKQLQGTPGSRFVALVIPEKLADGEYKLSLLAVSPDQRIAAMQLSSDGKTWSEPRPYEAEIRWHGQGKVFVRFRLETERGAEWSRPVHAPL